MRAFKITAQPDAFRVRIHRHIHASAMVEPQGAMQAGFAVGADGKRLSNSLREGRLDRLQIAALRECPLPSKCSMPSVKIVIVTPVAGGFLAGRDGFLQLRQSSAFIMQLGERARQIQTGLRVVSSSATDRWRERDESLSRPISRLSIRSCSR